MIHDQADELRQLVRQRALSPGVTGPPVPLVVASGGKGGVGNTTIALNLTVALARQGRRAVFIDADLDHGGHAWANAAAERGTVLDVLSGRRSVHEVLERGPAGIQIVPGAWAAGGASEITGAAPQRFVQELTGLAPHAEVVVVDAGSGRSPLVRGLWQAASIVLVVTTTDPAAIMESYAAIKVLQASESQPPVYTLVNWASDATAAAGVQSRINEASRRFLGTPTLTAGHVPHGEARPAAEPLWIFAPRGEQAKAMDRAADTIWARLQLASAVTGRTDRRSA